MSKICMGQISSATYLTAKSSRQNIKLMTGVAFGPKAFLPISEYDRIRGSDRIMCARIFALNASSGLSAAWITGMTYV